MDYIFGTCFSRTLVLTGNVNELELKINTLISPEGRESRAPFDFTQGKRETSL